MRTRFPVVNNLCGAFVHSAHVCNGLEIIIASACSAKQSNDGTVDTAKLSTAYLFGSRLRLSAARVFAISNTITPLWTVYCPRNY